MHERVVVRNADTGVTRTLSLYESTCGERLDHVTVYSLQDPTRSADLAKSVYSRVLSFGVIVWVDGQGLAHIIRGGS